MSAVEETIIINCYAVSWRPSVQSKGSGPAGQPSKGFVRTL
jgi:hypothetical protein